MDVQFCVVLEPLELVQDGPDKWEGIVCDLVEFLVVYNRPEFIILLLEEEWGSPGGVSTVDPSSGQIFVNPFLEFHMVSLWHRVELGLVWLGTILELDIEVNSRSMWGEDIKIFLSENFWEGSCPVRGSRGDMGNSANHGTGLIHTTSEFNFLGNPINCWIVLPEPIITKHELVTFIPPQETSDGFLMSKSKINNDLRHVGDESISIHSSICIVGDHWGMKLGGQKIVMFCKI